MAWVPAAIMGGSSLLGSTIGGKNAQKSADDAAKQQQQMAQQVIAQQEQYNSQQQQQQRNAIAGLLGGGNPFFAAAGNVHPQYEAPGANAAYFGSGGAPGTFSGSVNMSGPGMTAPQSAPQSVPGQVGMLPGMTRSEGGVSGIATLLAPLLRGFPNPGAAPSAPGGGTPGSGSPGMPNIQMSHPMLRNPNPVGGGAGANPFHAMLGAD